MGGQAGHRVPSRVREGTRICLQLGVLKIFEPVYRTNPLAQDSAQVIMSLHQGTAASRKNRFKGGWSNQGVLYTLNERGHKKTDECFLRFKVHYNQLIIEAHV